MRPPTYRQWDMLVVFALGSLFLGLQGASILLLAFSLGRPPILWLSGLSVCWVSILLYFSLSLAANVAVRPIVAGWFRIDMVARRRRAAWATSSLLGASAGGVTVALAVGGESPLEMGAVAGITLMLAIFALALTATLGLLFNRRQPGGTWWMKRFKIRIADGVAGIRTHAHEHGWRVAQSRTWSTTPITIYLDQDKVGVVKLWSGFKKDALLARVKPGPRAEAVKTALDRILDRRRYEASSPAR